MAGETLRAVEHLFPEGVGEEEVGPVPEAIEAGQLWHPIPAARTGYLQSLDAAGLLDFARERRAVVRMERGLGQFVIEGTPLVSVLGTTVPDEGEYWFKVWLVVLDDQLYVRLGTRAAERVEQSSTRPYLGVRVAGQTFPRVRAEPAPERVGGVADAMAKKYWSDALIHFFPHPLTLRLLPE